MFMKKIILILIFIMIFQGAHAVEHKDKFMLSFNVGSTKNLDEGKKSGTSYGLQIDYFLQEQLLVGLNFNHSEYSKSIGTTGCAPDILYQDVYFEKWEWDSLILSGKILFEPGRFTPFFKAGFGLYMPQRVHSEKASTRYLKTCTGFNFCAGIQYRVWKNIGILSSGTLNVIYDRDNEISYNDIFHFADFNAGIFMVF